MELLSKLFIMAYDLLGTALQVVWVWLFDGTWYGGELVRTAVYYAQML